MQDAMERHCQTVVSAIEEGQLVPFLGAGANLCDRPDGTTWRAGDPYLPSGAELAGYLASSFRHAATADLTRVSQEIFLVRGLGPLYQTLRSLLDFNYPPTLLHKLLAVLPRVFRDKGLQPCHQLIVTTNYDDVLERTFHASREPFDLVSYVAEGEHQGRFLHWRYAPDPAQHRCDGSRLEEFWSRWPPNVSPQVIEIANEYSDLSFDRGPVILKIHGAVDRSTEAVDESRLDSFVITEDNYIDYLAYKDISALIPAKLFGKMKRSHFLFLGYSLRDWNLRVILRRIWREQRKSGHWNSWAIQLDPEELERKSWQNHGVEINSARLQEYTTQLITLLGASKAIADLEKHICEIGAQSQTQTSSPGV